MCEGSAVTAHLPTIITQLIQEERSGQLIKSDAIRKCIDSFVKLGVDPDDSAKPSLDFYHKTFLTPFLQDSRHFYQTWSNECLSSHTVVDYVSMALLRLEEEEKRGQHYLHSSSVAALVEACQVAFVQPHASVLQNAFVTMLGQDTPHNLSQLYALLARIPHALEPLTPALFEHVRSEGLALVAGTVPETGDLDVSDYVHAIVEMHTKNIAMVKSNFHGDPGFLTAVGKVSDTVSNRTCRSISQR
jgi:cullin 3